MTDKISLPDGGWAVLRDPKKVTERQREPLLELQAQVIASDAGDYLIERDRLQETGVDDDEAAVLLRPLFKAAAGQMVNARQLDNIAVATLVESWSFDEPVTPDGVRDIPVDARDELVDAVRQPLARLLGNTTDEDVEAADSPTGAGNG